MRAAPSLGPALQGGSGTERLPSGCPKWRACAAYLAAFDIHVTPEFLIAEGDMVVVHDSNRLKHVGAFQGIPPTGKEAPCKCCDEPALTCDNALGQAVSDIKGGCVVARPVLER